MQASHIEFTHISLDGLAWTICCMYVYDVAYCSQGDDEQDGMKLIQVPEKAFRFREATDMAFVGLLTP